MEWNINGNEMNFVQLTVAHVSMEINFNIKNMYKYFLNLLSVPSPSPAALPRVYQFCGLHTFPIHLTGFPFISSNCLTANCMESKSYISQNFMSRVKLSMLQEFYPFLKYFFNPQKRQADSKRRRCLLCTSSSLGYKQTSFFHGRSAQDLFLFFGNCRKHCMGV